MILDVGGGHESRCRQFYPEAGVVYNLDLENGHDVMKDGLIPGPWEVIFANHFIEHVVDTDFFLRECRKVMSSSTVLEIGTPNLCAWFNRILFLFGYLPHSYEVSYNYNVGKPFNWNEERIGGHVRVFSSKALVEILKKHGFKIVSVVGEASTYKAHWFIMLIDKLMTKLSTNLASAVRVKCTL